MYLFRTNNVLRKTVIKYKQSIHKSITKQNCSCWWLNHLIKSPMQHSYRLQLTLDSNHPKRKKNVIVERMLFHLQSVRLAIPARVVIGTWGISPFMLKMRSRSRGNAQAAQYQPSPLIAHIAETLWRRQEAAAATRNFIWAGGLTEVHILCQFNRIS